MIHYESTDKGIKQQLKGTGETILTELMLIISAFKEEGFPKELIELAVEFAYTHDISSLEKDYIRSKAVEEGETKFDSIFGDIFKDKN